MKRRPKAAPRQSKARLPRWRVLLTALCLLGFLAFFAPVFAGILNPANLAAMAAFWPWRPPSSSGPACSGC